MAKYHGRSGALFLAAANGGSAASVVNLTQWTLNQDIDLVEVSALGDAAKSYVVGLSGATLSFSGQFADDADIPFDAFDQVQSGGKVAAYLYPAGSSVARYWHGYVFPKGVSVDVSIGGASSIKGDATFTGACTRVG